MARRYNPNTPIIRKPQPFILFSHGANPSYAGKQPDQEAPVVPTPKIFWYHRYEESPTLTVEQIAVQKGMIPIFNIANSSHSWGSTYETMALQFQSDNNNCVIALSQAFWDRTATTAVAWDPDEWAKYVTKRQEESSTLIMMIDVEPPQNYPHVPSTCLLCSINEKRGLTIGVPGSSSQVAAARAFVTSQTKFSYALPELRGPTDVSPTTEGSMYNIFPALGNNQIAELTYTPGLDYSSVNPRNVIGLRVTTDGRSYSYTPEAAKAAWPGYNKMYFNIEETEEAKLEIINKL